MTRRLLIALALILPAATALLHPAVRRAAPNLREAVTLLGAVLLFAAMLALLSDVLAGARPALARARRPARPVDRLRGRAARHAVRDWSPPACGSSTRSIRSATCAPNGEPRQTMFYVCFAVAIAATMGIALCRQPVHAVPVLRAADAFDLSARHPSPATPEAQGRRPALSSDAARRLDRSALAGDRLDRRRRRHARLSRRAASSAASSAPVALGDPARALRLRHRQGRGHAAAFLAAGGDGRADPGFGAASRRRRGQGRRLRHPQGRSSMSSASTR